MKTFFGWLLLTVVLYVLETSLLPLIYIFGTGPDLLMLETIAFAFLKGRQRGAFMGFLLGLMEDLASGGFLGLNTFINMLLGYGCGVFSNRVLRDSFVLPIAAACSSTVFAFFVYEIIFLLLGYGFYPIAHLKFKLLPMLFYNIIFAWPIYSLVHRVDVVAGEKKQQRSTRIS